MHDRRPRPVDQRRSFTEDGAIETASPQPPDHPHRPDVEVVSVDGREFLLVGTAHISRESADLVRRVIESERPDCVCIELDRQRYAALSQRDRFESLDLMEVIRRRQLSALLLNLVLASYQRQLGGQLGVIPGTEFLEAVEAANAHGIPVELCDRDVRVTLRRAWAALSWWRKWFLLGSLAGALFERPQLTEDDLRELRQQDVGSRLIQELGEAFPGLKGVLIDERDAYLTEKMTRAPGRRVVAVVGAGHVAGMRRKLQEGGAADLAALDAMPPPSRVGAVLGWSIPITILAAIGAIGWQHGVAAARESLIVWALASGLPSMVGAAAALAHPATVVTALVAAPITTLTPLMGVGYVAAFAQTYFRPPLVRELHTVWQDVGAPRQWWRNRLLRIFLVFLFTTLGASLGMFVGSAEILSKLF
jgi:pheromone shutdown-related protein TraB